MAYTCQASESLRGGGGSRNVPASTDSFVDNQVKCFKQRTRTVTIYFCNTSDLSTNLSTTEHHFFSTPDLLFLTETWVSEATEADVILFPLILFFSKFQPKVGCCAYARNFLLACSHT